MIKLSQICKRYYLFPEISLSLYPNTSHSHSFDVLLLQNHLKQLQNSVSDFDELELSDFDGPIRVAVGDTFLHLPLDAAKEEIETQIEKLKKQINELQSVQEKRSQEMLHLKATLTAKFGKSINLEEED